MQLITGLYNASDADNEGWRILLEREKHPFIPVERAEGCTVLVCEGELPPDALEFMEKGGMVVFTGASPKKLPFEADYRFRAVVENIELPDTEGLCRIISAVQVFGGEGEGLIRVHEKRKIKAGIHHDEYPAAVFKAIGKGGCWFSGVPLSMLVTAMGDTLRNVDDFSAFTERVVSVDKHKVLKFMKRLLRDAYKKLELPYLRLSYYPEGYRNFFTFRADLDGIFGNLTHFCEAAEACNIPISMFANKLMCEDEAEQIRNVSDMHYIGNHSRLHNLYTDFEDNLKNLTDAEEWMAEEGIAAKKGFVAPRGLWNPNLQKALEQLDYEFTSDFGYVNFGLPFFPYIDGRRSEVLQIPVSPFSTERANVQAREEWGREGITPEEVTDYFLTLLEQQYRDAEPSVIYSHPEVFGSFAEKVFPHIRAFLDKHPDIWVTSMDKVSDWWKARDKADYTAEYSDAGVAISGFVPEGLKVIDENA